MDKREWNPKEIEKNEEAARLKKRYGRLGERGKALLKKAHRIIFRDDILQPYDREFKNTYHKTWKNRQHIYDAQDRHQNQVEKEVEDQYRKTKGRNIVTLETKTLKELQQEHPNMINESDIIKHSE